VGFLWAGASNESEVLDDGNFWRFVWHTSETLEIMPAMLHGDMLPLVCL